MPPLFVQMIVLPTGTVTVVGLKPLFVMLTDFVTGFGAGVGVGVAFGVGLGVGVACCVGVAVGARDVAAVGLTWVAGCEGDVLVFDDGAMRLLSATKPPKPTRSTTSSMLTPTIILTPVLLLRPGPRFPVCGGIVGGGVSGWNCPGCGPGHDDGCCKSEEPLPFMGACDGGWPQSEFP
jgi:hypothetical protein